MTNNKILNNLNFLIESGVHEFMEDSPQIRYKEKIATIKKTNNICGDLTNLTTIEELKLAIKNFDKCELKKNALNTVISDGNPNAKIMLIGEAPGADEDKEGIPFVGRAGKLLNKMLEAINLSRDNVYITNIVPWRPPGNRQPKNEEIIMCLPFVQKHIELINPDILVLLGGTAAKAILLTEEGVMKLRGRWHEYSSYGLQNPIPTRVIFHPAFLLRSPTYKKDTWLDLQKIESRLNKK